MKSVKGVLLLLALLALTACSTKTSYMSPLIEEPKMIQSDESAIVFMRPSVFGGAIQAPIAEIKDDGLVFVAISSSGTRILHKTTPGKHLYLVGGESAHLLEADLEAGMVYYVYVKAIRGLWKARFQFNPVTDLTDKSFRKDYIKCKWYTENEKAEQWFQENYKSLEYKTKTQLDKDKQAYLTSDLGINSLIF